MGVEVSVVEVGGEAPSGAKRVTLAPVELVTKVSPERSMAMAEGAESDPPVYPPAGDIAAPSGENSLTLLAEFETREQCRRSRPRRPRWVGLRPPPV